jgi:DNA-binding NarL/FixJ family response regulator
MHTQICEIPAGQNIVQSPSCDWMNEVMKLLNTAIGNLLQAQAQPARGAILEARSLLRMQLDPLPPAQRSYSGGILVQRTQSVASTSRLRGSPASEILSPRERSVLRSMSCGLSNKRIAQELQIAPETVKSHVKGIFIKLAVQSRAHAVSTAGAMGLL